LGEATGIARRFLDLFERRELAEAAKLLTEDFEMVWPGNARFRTFAELAAWGKGRYRSIKNVYEAWEEAPTPDGIAVYVTGTLTGELGDGTPFAGVRFVDRLLIRGGRIASLQAWSDLGDTLRRMGR